MDKRLSLLQKILNGDIFRSEKVAQQYPLLVLIGIFIFVSILMGFISEWQYVHIGALKKELHDARNEELTISSELVNSTRQSAVARTLKDNGSKLREANTPVIVIK
ncbi:MAG: hypothetical protein J6W89_03770 [Paludibacteraceae bacterium]|nr:hypothetical protein [Paludibacteraceae bacterium]